MIMMRNLCASAGLQPVTKATKSLGKAASSRSDSEFVNSRANADRNHTLCRFRQQLHGQCINDSFVRTTFVALFCHLSCCLACSILLVEVCSASHESTNCLCIVLLDSQVEWVHCGATEGFARYHDALETPSFQEFVGLLLELFHFGFEPGSLSSLLGLDSFCLCCPCTCLLRSSCTLGFLELALLLGLLLCTSASLFFSPLGCLFALSCLLLQPFLFGLLLLDAALVLETLLLCKALCLLFRQRGIFR